MKLVDSNLWLALALISHEHHGLASEWLQRQDAQDVAFCRMTQLALLRLLTTRAVMSPYGTPPLTNVQAWELYRELSSHTRISFAPEPDELEVHWRRLSGNEFSSPKLWMDAYLAAFATAGKHQLVTIDSGFRQFRGLELVVLR